MAEPLRRPEWVAPATAAGASVRLLGDPAQLAAVDAGGALSLLETEVGATYLTDLRRFTDPAEGQATLALRTGDPEALRFYTDRDRIRAGSREVMLEAAYDAWAADVRAGKVSVLLAASTADVAALNARAAHGLGSPRRVQGIAARSMRNVAQNRTSVRMALTKTAASTRSGRKLVLALRM